MDSVLWLSCVLQPLLMTAHERQQGPSANPKVEFGPESQTPKSRGLYRWGCLLPSYCQCWSGGWKGLESIWWSHLAIWNACRPSWCIGLITKDHRGPWTPRTPVGTSVLSCDLNLSLAAQLSGQIQESWISCFATNFPLAQNAMAQTLPRT